jgi:hypothetical protein
MLAWIDNSTPNLFNVKSVVLFLVLSFLAYLISPCSPLEKKERDRPVRDYPMLFFVYVLLFQVFLLSLNPYAHYYLSPPKAFHAVARLSSSIFERAEFSVVSGAGAFSKMRIGS